MTELKNVLNPTNLLLHVRPRGDLALSFLYGNGLSGRNVCELVHLPTGPVDFDRIGFRFRSHAESQHQFALREIAGGGLHCEPLLVAPGGHANDGADAVAVRFCAGEFDAQALVGATLVEVEMRRAAIGHEEDVESTVVIDVGVGGAPCDFRSGEGAPNFIRDLFKLAVPELAEQVRRLRVADALLYALDLIFDVAVGDEDVLPAVVIVVEEETAEAERYERRTTDFRARSFIHEQAVAFVVVEREHLVCKICNDEAGAAGTVIIHSINAHAGAGHAIFAERDASRNGTLFEGAILFIQVELVGLRVVGDQDVGPSVVVVVENGDAESLRRRIVKARFLGGVFKLAVAQVMPEARRRSL